MGSLRAREDTNGLIVDQFAENMNQMSPVYLKVDTHDDVTSESISPDTKSEPPNTIPMDETQLDFNAPSPRTHALTSEIFLTKSHSDKENHATETERDAVDERTNVDALAANESMSCVGGGLDQDYDSAFIETPENASISEPPSLDAIDLSRDSSAAGSEPGTPNDAEKASTDGTDIDSVIVTKRKTWWRFWKGKEVDATARKGHSPRAEQLVSTTGLLMEARPVSLPVKSEKEERKHRAEYEQMIQQAKKKEQRELEKQIKQRREKCKKEDELANSVSTWKTDILPTWDTMRNNKAVLDMWWHGLPPSIRGTVWKRAIGNGLQITEDLYEIFLSRAREKLRIKKLNREFSTEIETSLRGIDHEKSVEVVHLDVSRTFPQLGIFQEGGPMFQSLHDVLEAYACYRPDVGYVQGMSFLAAVLLLNMDVSDAFVCLANLVSRPCHLAFFRVDEQKISAYFEVFKVFFNQYFPKLYAHFVSLNLAPNMFLLDWICTLYSRSLPLDIACRVWDVYFRDGDEFLFKTALGILSLFHSQMLEMEFIDLARFVTRIPQTVNSDELFSHIARVNITTKRYEQVLTAQLAVQQQQPPS